MLSSVYSRDCPPIIASVASNKGWFQARTNKYKLYLRAISKNFNCHIFLASPGLFPQETNSSPNVPNIGSTSSSANVVTEPGEANDTQRLHSEVESLRREMERLRAQGLIIEAPPSYTDGDR